MTDSVDCLDCGKKLEVDSGAVEGAYAREDMSGNLIGFVCNECHFKKKEKPEEILKAVEDYKDKQENIESTFEKFIMERVFGDMPETEALGKRVRVVVKDTSIQDSIRPTHSVKYGGMSDVAAKYTREVSMDINITLVYPAKKE